ncbi:ABC transporter substrate binding protein [Lactobacillus delbrueckii subsp. bulgaricus]
MHFANQGKEVAKYAKKDGLKVTKYTFSDTNDVNSVTQQVASASDVIYIPTDNTAASCAKTINGTEGQGADHRR